MRLRNKEIKRIIIHCSAFEKEHDIKDIRKWHLKRGFDDVGYHFVITKNGTIQTGRPIKYIGAHARSHNHDSIGICICADRLFSDEQISSLCVFIDYLMTEHRVPLEGVIAHNEVNDHKTCPNIPGTVLRALIGYFRKIPR